MDTFFEQIVSIRKSGKKIAAVIAIWLLAVLLCGMVFLLSGILGGLMFLLIAGILYGAYKLSGTLNVEYEYIITNGTMDVDKIVNKQSRQRILSFDISKTTRMESYNDGLLAGADSKNIVIACNRTDPNAYLLVYEKNGKQMNLVFSPNEKMQSVVAKYLPKFISNSLFK
ncbi:MAG: hypothetical protein IJD45_03400 [Clostridia bacterium]|nr:hypothetical protein [Clostridia bacterium]